VQRHAETIANEKTPDIAFAHPGYARWLATAETIAGHCGTNRLIRLHAAFQSTGSRVQSAAYWNWINNSMWRRVGLICLIIAVAMPCRAESDAVGAWRNQLVARLNASKLYAPTEAVGKGGSVKVGFAMDRSGKLILNQIVQSSGVEALDSAALALVERAQPFPTPPAELADDELKFTLPVKFAKWPQTSTEISKEDAKVNAKLRSICRGC
jgi:protein TonB